MSTTKFLYPLLLQPVLHPRVWGGRRLEAVFGKRLPSDAPYGESWELHDTVTVANGALAGKTIGELVTHMGPDLIGYISDPTEGFPLLVKFLDASDWLSVQVHPNDEQARELEGDPRGKTEAWIILAAEAGAQLVCGVRAGTTRAEMAAAIRENRLQSLLIYADVAADDVLFIRANTVHAIGPGLLIYEIQQASDITYRLYDWGRLGLDGQPRPLHIEKGVAVSNLESVPPIAHIADNGAMSIAVTCEYFTTVAHRLDGYSVTLDTGARFQALTCVAGEVSVRVKDDALSFKAGQTVLIPAAVHTYTLEGRGKILRSFQS